MNPVLILTHNCLELTKKCVESIWKQDVDTEWLVIDNGSTDGTFLWAMQNEAVKFVALGSNTGVSKGWNFGLDRFFSDWGADHVLVANNDTILPPYFYSKLLSYDLPFVTGVSVDRIEDHPDSWPAPAEHPDFSAFLIRRDCWEKVGPFDETMKHYASDLDYHLRAHLAGIPLMNAGAPFHHKRSSTIRNADPFDRSLIERQADTDRETFYRKWGVAAGSPEYRKLFEETNAR